MRPSAYLISILIHSAAAAAIWAASHTLTADVAGSAGLIGSPDADFAVELVAPVRKTQARAEAPVKALPMKVAAEGIAVPRKPEQKLATELPSETKAEPRIIEEAEAETVETADADTDETSADEVQTTQAKNVGAETRGDPEAPQGLRGQGGTSNTPSLQVGHSTRTNPLGLYMDTVRGAIQRELTRGMAVERTHVTWMTFAILRNGHVDEISLKKSSGSARLDHLASLAIRRAQPFRAQEFNDRLVVTVPVVFKRPEVE